MKISYIFSGLVLLYEVLVTTSSSAKNGSSLSSCSECIASVSCIWCSTPGYAQCFSDQDTDKLLSCTQLVDPQSETTITELPLDEFHQVSVESVHMKLRVGETQNFTVSVRSAENFPLDLYILMDFSTKFKNDLASVRKKAEDIVTALQKMTSQFRVGFGKFTDKSTPPYTSYSTLNLEYTVNGQKSSCASIPGQTSPCGRPIPYEHVVNLTNSSMEFSSAIQSLFIEISTDDPEGVLDAMMQAVVCTDIVGWREEARKVLLVMTDEVAHTAGDGRLAAIHTPNDGQCHTQYDPQLNKIVYVGSLDYDYPSLEQMRLALLENEIVPVFAVRETGTIGLQGYYEHIASTTEGFSVTPTFGSENIVDVISDAYDEIISRLRLSYVVPGFLTVTHIAECPTNDSLDSSCTDIGNQTANFTVFLTLNECPKQELTSHMKFRFPGFGNFLVSVEGICECSCTHQSGKNSPNCSGNGDLSCGLCTCSEGWEGEICSCSMDECPVGHNGKTCSGKGSCVCGQCQCDPVTTPYPGVDEPMVFGEACDCDNFRCDTDEEGMVCSGRGTCKCAEGESHCECGVSAITGLPHMGDHCQCSHDHCVNPDSSSSALCSGRGTCDPCRPQGRACSCTDWNVSQYCALITGQCTANLTCVQCYAHTDMQDMSEACPLCSKDTCMLYDYQNSAFLELFMQGSSITCYVTASSCPYIYIAGITQKGEHVFVIEPVEADYCTASESTSVVWLSVVYGAAIFTGTTLTGLLLLGLAIKVSSSTQSGVQVCARKSTGQEINLDTNTAYGVVSGVEMQGNAAYIVTKPQQEMAEVTADTDYDYLVEYVDIPCGEQLSSDGVYELVDDITAQ